MRILKVIVASALSVAAASLVLALSLRFGGTAPRQSMIQPGDSTAIVVVADVKDWEPIIPDGRIDPTQPDRQINVVGDIISIGQHTWIVRFKVIDVVKGQFDLDEVRMLTHSPSQDGVKSAGQRFVLSLTRRSRPPKAIASSDWRLAQGLSWFTLAETLYELNSERPLTPAVSPQGGAREM